MYGLEAYILTFGSDPLLYSAPLMVAPFLDLAPQYSTKKKKKKH